MTETRAARRPAMRSAPMEDMELTAFALDLPDQSAYLAYYGLGSVPFRASADPKHLWLGPRQQRVLDTLTAAVAQGTGVVLLTGEMGTGKTSLVNGLADRLASPGFALARLPGVGLDAADVLVALAGALRLPGTYHSKSELLSDLAAITVNGSSRDTIVLIIDEAQSLGPQVLRELGELASAAATSGCPLCILLVGQAELTWELADQRHAELRQHVTTRCALDPLSESEVAQYVRHCLELAGATHEIFSRGAIEAIASLSRGAPAAINSICERALLTGHRRQLRVIEPSVIADSGVAQRSQPVPRPPIMQPATSRRRALSAAPRPEKPPARAARRAMYASVAIGVLLIGAAAYSLHLGGLGRGQEAAAPRGSEHATTTTSVAAAAHTAASAAHLESPTGGVAAPVSTTIAEKAAVADARASSNAAVTRAPAATSIPVPTSTTRGTATEPSISTPPVTSATAAPRAATITAAPTSTTPVTSTQPPISAAAPTPATPATRAAISTTAPISTTAATATAGSQSTAASASAATSSAAAASVSSTAETPKASTRTAVAAAAPSTGPAVVTATVRSRAADVAHRRAALPDGARRRAVSPSAAADATAPMISSYQPAAPETRAVVAGTTRRASGTEADAGDPGSVIDWLLNEHPRSRR